MRKHAVLLLFLASMLFRMSFISLFPQPFGYDQQDYETYAGKMFNASLMLASHSYRSYPYPLMLAVLYKVVGFGNHQAVFFLQAVLDSLAGLLIYLILRYGLINKLRAWIGFILYAINPFTSGYVGVLLSEVLSAFTVIGTIAAGAWFVVKPSWRKGLLFGLLAGLAAETRSAAFAWAAIPVGLATVSVVLSIRDRPKRMHVLLPISSILVGIILTLLYPLYVNWRDYRELNATTVDNIFARELFNGAILRKLPPFTIFYPPEVQQMYGEYYSEYNPGRTTTQRKAMADKYRNKALAIIRRDPKGYIANRFEKMWYVWQKENIFFYREPGFASHRMVIYYGNAILLLLAALGLLFWPQSRRYVGTKFVRWSIIGTILYGTLAFSLTHAEYRLTIPFYPLLILAAAVGLGYLREMLRRLRA